METANGELATFLERTIDLLKIPKDAAMKVIVWRDGVSESQLPDSREIEVTQLLRCFSTLRLQAASLSFVICQKRIHTKFFVMTKNGSYGNPMKGIYVSSLRNPMWDDFYLYSTETVRSTSKPVRYIVVEPDKSLPLNKLVALTYYMTFMYQNWPGPVKLPAPTQLAHVLAKHVGLLRDPDPNIPFHQFVNRPFYL